MRRVINNLIDAVAIAVVVAIPLIWYFWDMKP